MNLALTSMLLLSLWMPSFQYGGGQQEGLVLNVQVEPGQEKAEIRLNLENQGEEPAKFEFPTSQLYEITILDENGGEVYLFSKGRAFLQAIQHLTVQPGASKEWKETWNYTENGVKAPPGNYKALVVMKGSKLNGKPLAPGMIKAKTEFRLPAEGEDRKAEEPSAETIFWEIRPSGTAGTYAVSGKARPKTGEFFYTVEDGHNQLIPETKVAVGSKYPDWGQFELKLTIPANQLPKSGTLILNIYEKDGGTITGQPVAVILEQFRGE